MVSKKGRQAQTSVYLSEEALLRLQQLSKRTKVPMAAYLREAVDDLLQKHDSLKRKPK